MALSSILVAATDDDEDVEILALINDEKIKHIFLSIINNPGLTQKEISDLLRIQHQTVIWFTQKLENVELISTLEDGKFKRYYPTNRLAKLSDMHISKMKAFREWVIKKFKYDGIDPEVVRVTDKFILLRVSIGKDKTSLELPTNPFLTVLGLKKDHLLGG